MTAEAHGVGSLLRQLWVQTLCKPWMEKHLERQGQSSMPGSLQRSMALMPYTYQQHCLQTIRKAKQLSLTCKRRFGRVNSRPCKKNRPTLFKPSLRLPLSPRLQLEAKSHPAQPDADNVTTSLLGGCWRRCAGGARRWIPLTRSACALHVRRCTGPTSRLQGPLPTGATGTRASVRP